MVTRELSDFDHGAADSSGEIDFAEVVERLRAGWKLIALTIIVAGGIAFGIAFWMTPIYTATVLLAITTQDDSAIKGQGLSKLASQFGAAADILNFGGQSDPRAEAIATLQSRVLTETYIREQNLLPVLFASKWDASRGQWNPGAKQPTLWDANKLFNRKIRTVSEDKKTSLVTLTISWQDKELAAKWATGLVARTNEYLRENALEVSKRHIDYLTEELKHTNALELQEAIYRLLEAEIKKTMLARGNTEYAFNTIDPAVVPEERSRPLRLLIGAYGILGGLFLGVILVFARGSKLSAKS